MHSRKSGVKRIDSSMGQAADCRLARV